MKGIQEEMERFKKKMTGKKIFWEGAAGADLKPPVSGGGVGVEHEANVVLFAKTWHEGARATRHCPCSLSCFNPPLDLLEGPVDAPDTGP